MTNEELNTALYKKMFAEQEQFKGWLLTQAPERILEHSYEYTVREDFLLSLEYNDLTSSQAAALLASPTPLDDLFHQYEKMESSHMEEVWSCFENRAEQVKSMQAEAKVAVYQHNADYAREHGELEQYRASNRVNIQCKEAIETAVREHFDGLYLSHDAAKGVIETYGMDRVAMVLANTIQLQDWDGRYSRSNKDWARTIPNHNSDTVRLGYALECHPAVLNGFIDLVREEQQRQPRASVREHLKQGPKQTVPKASTHKKREPER